MKKLLVTLAVLFGSTVLVGRADIAQAVYRGNIVVSDDFSSLTPSTIEAEVGDQINISNASGVPVYIGGGQGDTGLLTAGLGGPQCSGANNCNASPNYSPYIASTGTVTLRKGGATLTLTIVPPGGGGGGGPTVTFDLQGGTCFGKSEWTGGSWFGALPDRSHCAKPGFGLVGWTWNPSQTGDADIVTWNTDRSGTLYAVWRPAPGAPGALSVLANFLCGPCTSAVLSWEPSPTAGVSYEVSVLGPSATNRYSTFATTMKLWDLEPGSTYRVQVQAVKDGVRSEVTTSGPKSNVVELTLNGSITIGGERCSVVRAKSRVCVRGATIGFAPGTTLVPYVKTPGRPFTQSTDRPVIQSDGSFQWVRTTSRKVDVYFTDSAGNVVSNRITIAAA